MSRPDAILADKFLLHYFSDSVHKSLQRANLDVLPMGTVKCVCSFLSHDLELLSNVFLNSSPIYVAIVFYIYIIQWVLRLSEICI